MNVSGTWLGTYWQDNEPTRFEVTFAQGGNGLSGSILDDSYLGEAHLTGEVIGRSIRFTKQYIATSPTSINYSGNISEDENSMSGTWRIDRRFSGRWEAHRSNQDLLADLKNRLNQQVPVGIS